MKVLTNVDANHNYNQGDMNGFVEGGAIVEMDLQIFNRYGQLVFHSTDPNEGWDGTFAGDNAPTDTYAYATTYSYLVEGNTVQVTFKGSVVLVR